jgi:hypothetical protein
MIVKIEINNIIIDKATKCHANLSCLNDKDTPKCSDRLAMCPVESKIGDGMVFVNFNHDISCIYNIPFVDNQIICNCPVRYEIYERYNI